MRATIVFLFFAPVAFAEVPPRYENPYRPDELFAVENCVEFRNRYVTGAPDEEPYSVDLEIGTVRLVVDREQGDIPDTMLAIEWPEGLIASPPHVTVAENETERICFTEYSGA